jgi:cytochrome P450
MTSFSPQALDAAFLSEGFFEDPYPFYRALHAQAPIYYSAKVNAWLVSSFVDVEAGLKDARLLSGGRIDSAAAQLPEANRDQNATLIACMNSMMSFRDDPDHARLRRLVSKAFTARSVARLEPQIQLIVDELLDEIGDDDTFDLVARFSFDLPALVICRLLGIPRERLQDVKRWADGVVGFVSSGLMTPANAALGQEAVIEAGAYLDDLVRERRQHPQDDVLTQLASAQDDGDELSRDELVAMVILLFFAGFETTEGLIGNAVIALLRHPRQFAALRDDTSLIDRVVEEVLRYDNSIQRQSRVASCDVDFSGQSVAAGDVVFLMIGAANRDPAAFHDPDAFDIHRADLANLSFGMGVHFCLGAPLARLETKVALRTIVDRMPGLTLDDREPTYGRLLAVRKPTEVWVRRSA